MAFGRGYSRRWWTMMNGGGQWRGTVDKVNGEIKDWCKVRRK